HAARTGVHVRPNAGHTRLHANKVKSKAVAGTERCDAIDALDESLAKVFHRRVGSEELRGAQPWLQLLVELFDRNAVGCPRLGVLFCEPLGRIVGVSTRSAARC